MKDRASKGNTSGLTLLATVYTPSEAALLISALEGAGFDVFVPGYHMMANAQHFSVAFGGAKVMVPSAQAEDAAALLSQIEANAAQAAQEIDAPTPNNWFKRVVTGIVYLLTGTAPALAGRFLNIKNNPKSSGRKASDHSILLQQRRCEPVSDSLDQIATFPKEDNS